MHTKRLICNNFSGINRSRANFSDAIITASDMQNVELFSTETNSGTGIRTVNGNISVCDLIPENETIINIFESVQKANTYFFVHTEDESEGKIYLFSPEKHTLEQKVQGLSITGKSCGTDVSQGWSDLFVFSNSEEMLSIEIGSLDEDGKLNDVIMMDIEDMDGRKIKGLGLVIFAGRLWVFNNQILWYSVQENIYDFATSDVNILTSAGYIEFVKKITAIYPYLGSLAVFHSNSSCMIAQDEDKGFYKTFDSPGGCASYDALVFHGTQLYFYDDTKKGIFSFLQVVNGDKTLGENIAINIQDELLAIPSKKLDEIRTLSVVTSDRNEVWFLLPSDNENYSTIMIYDYLKNTWVKRKSQKINCFRIIASQLYSAGKKIYKEYESQCFDGEFIESFYKCSPMNLGIEYSLKILAFAPKVTLSMDYDNNFCIEYTKDYNSLTTKVRRIISKTLKNLLKYDITFWDSNYFPYEKINVIKKLPATFFKTLQITFFTEEQGQNFCINNIEFGKIKVKE